MKASKFAAYLIVAWMVVVVRSLLGVSSPQVKDPKFRFEDFPVQRIFRGRPARPVLKKDFLFRTKVREAARKGPNFAGHYTIAEWGCGSGCDAFALVDAISGQLYYPLPFGIVLVPAQDTPSGTRYGVDYHLDSSLVTAEACEVDVPASEQCSIRYFNWKGHQFHLLARINEPAAPPFGQKPSDKSSKP